MTTPSNDMLAPLPRIIRVLVIDDDEDDYLITRDLLGEIKHRRYDVSWASSYEQGRELIAEKHHDVYLVDYRLGACSGIDLLREASRLDVTAPIILLTGQGDYEVDLEAMSLGASDYLVKDRLTAPQLERSIRYSINQRRAEERITSLAYFDCLTGLPNRLLFHDRLSQAIAMAQRNGSLLGVLYLDLDNFKAVNDTMGHSVGDELLRQMAERLGSAIRQGDSVARPTSMEAMTTMSRLGGDEFIVLLADVKHMSCIDIVAQRIGEALSRPYLLAGKEIVVSASIGIAMYPEHGTDGERLLQHADAAMYSAKTRGANGRAVYEPSMTDTAVAKLQLEGELRQALAKEEFTVHYQPLVAMDSGALVGLEALVRWVHPTRGLVAPQGFLPLAEETGLIVPLSMWVLRRATVQFRRWKLDELPGFRLRVNLSSKQCRPELVESVSEILKEAQMDADQLELEITESFFVHQDATLHGLKELGTRLSVDDFGSGYFAFANLVTFPIDTIKIDKMFLADIEHDHNTVAVVGAIAAMVKAMGLTLVMEGVETLAQLEIARRMHCDVAQGFLLSHPVPAEQVPQIIEQERQGRGIGRQLFQRLLDHPQQRVPQATGSKRRSARSSEDLAESATTPRTSKLDGC